jgi:hypothetical protein
MAVGAGAAGIEVKDSGMGCEYMSGQPITLPAASLSTNLFGPGAQVIRNRAHTAKAAEFDANGRLQFLRGEPTYPLSESAQVTQASSTANGATRSTSNTSTNGFPAYLIGRPYVWFLQNVRHYTNYSCTITVAHPATFYLLVDNRVNDYRDDSSNDDPVFGPPDTQWVLDDRWKRVNTGLTPEVTATCAGDYVGIDEGNNGSINQVYAVYAKRLDRPGAVTLHTEFDGNIYCLVIDTNATKLAEPKQGTSQKKSAGS